jgi:hypothetical protein
MYFANHAAEKIFQIQDLHRKYEENTGRSAIQDLITMKIIQSEAGSDYNIKVYEKWTTEYYKKISE